MVRKWTQKMKSQWVQYVRVWKLLRKPSMQEFKTVSKVSSIGLLVIGAFGFAISVVMKIFTTSI